MGLAEEFRKVPAVVTALPEQVAPVTVVVMGECEARKAGYRAGYGRLCGSNCI